MSWCWHCRFKCVPDAWGPWVATRDEAEEGWKEHCSTHPLSNAKILRAIGVRPR